MTENMKKFLEHISGNEELTSKLKNASKEDVLALAKEAGFTLTDADFEQTSEVSDDELTTVVGGGFDCFCAIGGGGTGGEKTRTCACVVGGAGLTKDGKTRCLCTATGAGGL